jgi:hypothetical protein
MNAARVAAKFRTVRNLKVPLRVIYDMDVDDPNLGDVIDALDKASKHQHLSVVEAAKVRELVHMRHEFGDYPDATLLGMHELNSSKSCKPFRDDAFEALKREQPKTEEAAEAITAKVRRAYLAKQYKQELPAWVPDAALYLLDDEGGVLENERGEILERLLAAPQPSTPDEAFDAVDEAVHYVDETEETEAEDDDDETEDTEDTEDETENADGDETENTEDDGDNAGDDDEPFTPSPTELIEALRVVLSYARRPAPKEFKSPLALVDLAEIRDYITTLGRLTSQGNKVKRKADAAEATDRWIESDTL